MNEKIIETKTGVMVDMEQETGKRDAVVAVFRSANGYYVHATIGSLIGGGTPIEYEGEDEGEDMEYIGNGFLV